MPPTEVHHAINEMERSVGTHLYGRQMYEVLVAWETMDTAGQGRAIQDYAEIWRAADKVVYSRTLESASSERTRIERDFDPDAVRQMKRSAQRDISVGGPDLAAQALTAALVDELHLFLSPVIVGGGHAALPDDAHLSLELLQERRFANGVVHLHYRCDD